MLNPAEYPHFTNAEVLILAPTGDTWRLRAETLRSVSTVFADMLTIHAPSHVTAKNKSDGRTVQWRFEMKPTKDGRFATFEFFPAPNKNELLQYPTGGIKKPDEYLHMYDNLFRCMCNMDPSFYTGNQRLVNDAIGLLQAANDLKAVNCVRRDIETHLLRTGYYLWQRVLQDCEAWADIGMQIQSPVIFRESMIRLVGLWNVPSAINKLALVNLPTGVQIMDIVEKKVMYQTHRKLEIEERLRTFFPQGMLHPPSNVAGVATPGRSFYANDVYKWQALTLVRQYIVKEIIAGHGHVAADGGATFYRAIGTGAGAYCRAVDLDDWHKKFDMTAKGKQRLKDGLIYVKDELKSVVAELLVSNTNIATPEGDYPYLTHTEFKDEELPWYTAPTFRGLHQKAEQEEKDNEADDDDSLFVAPGDHTGEAWPLMGAAKSSPKGDSVMCSPNSSPSKDEVASDGIIGDDHGNSILAPTFRARNAANSHPMSQDEPFKRRRYD